MTHYEMLFEHSRGGPKDDYNDFKFMLELSPALSNASMM